MAWSKLGPPGSVYFREHSRILGVIESCMGIPDLVALGAPPGLLSLSPPPRRTSLPESYLQSSILIICDLFLSQQVSYWKPHALIWGAGWGMGVGFYA